MRWDLDQSFLALAVNTVSAHNDAIIWTLLTVGEAIVVKPAACVLLSFDLCTCDERERSRAVETSWGKPSAAAAGFPCSMWHNHGSEWPRHLSNRYTLYRVCSLFYLCIYSGLWSLVIDMPDVISHPAAMREKTSVAGAVIQRGRQVRKRWKWSKESVLLLRVGSSVCLACSWMDAQTDVCV